MCEEPARAALHEEIDETRRRAGVSVDGEGLAPTPQQLREPPRAMFVSPSHQYPTGVTLSLARRLARAVGGVSRAQREELGLPEPEPEPEPPPEELLWVSNST